MRKMLISLAIVLAACGGSDAADTETPSTSGPTDTSSDEVDGSALAAPTSIPVSDISAGHVDPPVSFDQSPSIGGDHYPFWQNCGFYNVEVLEGAAAHTMEHGAVWITYNASSISDEDLAALEQLAQDNGKLLISPYAHDEPLVLSAWGVQQRGITSVEEPQFMEFIDTWVDNPELAEAGVRCTGAAGVPPDDIRTLADGEQVPENYN